MTVDTCNDELVRHKIHPNSYPLSGLNLQIWSYIKGWHFKDRGREWSGSKYLNGDAHMVSAEIRATIKAFCS